MSQIYLDIIKCKSLLHSFYLVFILLSFYAGHVVSRELIQCQTLPAHSLPSVASSHKPRMGFSILRRRYRGVQRYARLRGELGILTCLESG